MPSHDSTGNLFASFQTAVPSGRAPLAERLRPRTFDDLVGQNEVVGPGRPLRTAIEQDQLSSVIFWGPPGCGKTTLAGLVAQYTKSQFVPFSAVTGGIPELREIIKAAEQRRAMGRATTLFVDEAAQRQITGCENLVTVQVEHHRGRIPKELGRAADSGQGQVWARRLEHGSRPSVDDVILRRTHHPTRARAP